MKTKKSIQNFRSSHRQVKATQIFMMWPYYASSHLLFQRAYIFWYFHARFANGAVLRTLRNRFWELYFQLNFVTEQCLSHWYQKLISKSQGKNLMQTGKRHLESDVTPHYKTRDSIHQECEWNSAKIISAKIYYSVIQNEDSRIKYFQLIARMALNRGKDYQVRRFQNVHLNKNSKPRTKIGKTFVLNRNTYRQLVASLYKHPKWLHYVRTLKLFLTLISYRLNVWVYTYSSVFRYPTLYWRYI